MWSPGGPCSVTEARDALLSPPAPAAPATAAAARDRRANSMKGVDTPWLALALLSQNGTPYESAIAWPSLADTT